MTDNYAKDLLAMKYPTRIDRPRLPLSLLAASLLAAMPALADDKTDIDLPAGRLEQALNSLAQQTGVQIIFASDVVGERTTPAVHGHYSAKEAMHRLLDPRGLQVQVQDAQTFVVLAPEASVQPTAAPAPAAPLAVDATVISGDVLGSGTGEDVRTYAGSRSVVGSEALHKASVRGVDEALQRVPGVKIFDETGTGALPQIALRGLYESRSGRLQALSDGIPLALAPYGQTGLSLFPVTMASVDRIDVVKGGAAVQYGPAAGL